MPLCSNCRTPIIDQACQAVWCDGEHSLADSKAHYSELEVQKNSKIQKQYPQIGDPGDIKEIIFKRYTITEQKRFKKYAGFDLWTQKEQGANQAWQIVKENKEIEGKNSFLRFLFGKEKQGNVFYLNTAALATTFNWPLLVSDKHYQVTLNLSVQVETPEYFLNQHQGYQELVLDNIRTALDSPLRRKLQIELEQLTKETTTIVDFTQFNSLLKHLASTVIEPFNLEVTELSTSGELLADAEQVKLAQEQKKLNNDGTLRKHQSKVSSDVAIQEVNDKAKVTKATIYTEKDIANVQAEKEANVQQIAQEAKLREVANNSLLTLQQLHGEKEIMIAQGSVDSALHENENTQLEHDIGVAGKKGKIKAINAQTDRDIKADDAKTALAIKEGEKLSDINIKQAAMESLIKTDVNYEMAKLDIERARNNPSNQHCAAKNTREEAKSVTTNTKETTTEPTKDKMPKRLIRCESVIDIIEQDAPVANVHNFGRYFWNLVMSRSPELSDLLTNARLHYIRYEDNYCLDLSSIINLYQIFETIKSFACYRGYSESHILFGPGKVATPQKVMNNFNISGRNELVQRLLDNDKSNMFVSQKNQTHDRDMCLVFTNGAHIRIKFTNGIAFWRLDTRKLPNLVFEKLKSPVEKDDITPDFVKSLKSLKSLISCKPTEKDTTLALWGWTPE